MNTRTLILCGLSLWQTVTLTNSQQDVPIIPDISNITIEPLLIDIRISNVALCQQTNAAAADCVQLMDLMVKCQQIIFNDLGFSYQEYIGNIDMHRQILARYQSMCDDGKANIQ
jgi:hypothetical protein